jgi:two-component system cell cycle response regulator DivK
MAQGMKKVLVVEDNDDCRELLVLVIQRLGYEVFEAGTGLHAVDRAAAIHPDLIMMDLLLPGMNGDQATACLKARPSTRDIPVVINTAYVANDETERALNAGAAEILHKPLDLSTLPAVLKKYLN